MQRARTIVLVVVSMLIPAVVLADDAGISLSARPAADLDSLSSYSYWRESDYAESWQTPLLIEPADYSNDSIAAIAPLEFRDTGALARVSKVRELSLLTLAEVGKARFFFGVNRAGLFGLHLGALPNLDDDRSVELARMPYLKGTSDDDVSPEAN
ncbi:MAG: hypothetical protein ACR2RD_17270 [Woeseiaceae bacterium]